MGLNCGIVGPPNGGQSTLLSALPSAPAHIANYPLCTIDPNVGIVSVPDSRLDRITELIPGKKRIPATVEFIDIAGLVAGASRGEGLGNRFLASIREVGMIVHVVRCFEDGDVVHVSGDVDPARDIETINIELALADLETVSKRHEKVARARSLSKEAQKHASEILPILQQLLAALGEGKSVRSLKLDDDRLSLLSDLHLLTLKPMIYVCNVDEEGIGGTSAYVDTVKRMAKEEDAEVVVICSKIESEIATLESEKEKQEFLEAVGLKESV